MNYVVVFVTVPSKKAGIKIANTIVKDKLAACVNVLGGLTSIYRWKDKIEKSPEALMIIKTEHVKFETLAKKIQSLHPYTVPEIIALPITKGNKKYLNWISSSLQR